jgi:transposase-like protein
LKSPGPGYHPGYHGVNCGFAALTAVIHEAYIQGVSTRSVDDLVKAMEVSGISKSQMSRLREEIDERFQAFLSRPIALRQAQGEGR